MQRAASENATSMIMDMLRKRPLSAYEIIEETGFAQNHVRGVLGILVTARVLSISRDPASGINRYRFAGYGPA